MIDPLTDEKREKCFVLDDSVIERSRSKTVELLARVYDHVIGKTVRGFNLLTLGWTDHYSFIPVGFNMMSSAKEKHRITELNNHRLKPVGLEATESCAQAEASQKTTKSHSQAEASFS